MKLDILQIGCSLPWARFDPVRPLLQRHPDWKALLVEPVPRLLRQAQEYYRRHTSARHLCWDCSAIASQSAERADFWEAPVRAAHDWQRGLSSFQQRLAQTASTSPNSIQVVVRTPAELLERHGVASVRSLYIDAEGCDGDILQAWPWERVAPCYVRFEHKHLADVDAIIGFLQSRQYVLVSFDGEDAGVVRCR
ncbi:MAG: FkbM family methyltransferase [Gemmataceae bacterium]